MKAFKKRSEQFESKLHAALHGHSTKQAKKCPLNRWSVQRMRHTKSVGEKRAPRNIAIELHSRLLDAYT